MVIISGVRLCAASNGLIVEYDKYEKDENNPLSDRRYIGETKEVFKLSEKSKAMDCFIEYSTKAGIIISDDKEEESTEE